MATRPLWQRWLIRLFKLLLVLVILAGFLIGLLYWYAHPKITRQDGIVYGHREEFPLTLDVLTPRRPNGLAIAVMVSGGWKSDGPGGLDTWMVSPLLRRGYTVFAVCHRSQPKATVMEIIADVNRGVRFIRHHASRYGIDPDRIGVTGGSAGGHLSLMLATRGGPGEVEHNGDPIDAASSAVQAVAIFYPVTDLLNLGESTENLGDGGPPKSFIKAFGSPTLEDWKGIGRDTSPIYHVHEDLPPILIHHGDADTLTPLDQSTRFQEAVERVGGTIQLRIKEGGNHGWLTMPWDIWQFAEWFDKHL